jgi:hypothetical protein
MHVDPNRWKSAGGSGREQTSEAERIPFIDSDRLTARRVNGVDIDVQEPPG